MHLVHFILILSDIDLSHDFCLGSVIIHLCVILF